MRRLMLLLLGLLLLLPLPCAVHAEEPQTDPVYRVTGNADFMGHWDPANDVAIMEGIAPGVYYIDFEDVPPGEYELKITENGHWERSWGSDGGNLGFALTEVGDVAVTFVLSDPDGGIYIRSDQVTIAQGEDTPVGGNSGEDEEKIYRVVGNAEFMGDWNPANDQGMMTEVLPNVYEVVFPRVSPGDYELKVTEGGLWDRSWGAEDGYNYTFSLAEELSVTVTFTLSGENGHIRVSTAPVIQEETNIYRVVGSADFMGNWDPANDQGIMTEVSPGVYKVTFEDVPPGNYELKVTKNGTWENCWGDNGNNCCVTMLQTAALTVTFTPKDGVVNHNGNGSSIATDNEPTKPTASEPVVTTLSVIIPSEITKPSGGEDTQPSQTDETTRSSVPAEHTEHSDPPDQTDPTVDQEASHATGDDVEQTEEQVSALANPPVHSLNMVWFISVAAALLFFFLTLIQRKGVIFQNADGTTNTVASHRSMKDTKNRICQSNPKPSDQMDQAVLEAFRKISKKDT